MTRSLKAGALQDALGIEYRVEELPTHPAAPYMEVVVHTPQKGYAVTFLNEPPRADARAWGEAAKEMFLRFIVQ